MSEQTIPPKGRLRLLSRFRQLDEATRRKFMRFVSSGLVIIVLGAALIVYGISVGTRSYSVEGLLVGFGVIIIVVGLIRILIGFIQPSTPDDLPPSVPPSLPSDEVQGKKLDKQLFGEPN